VALARCMGQAAYGRYWEAPPTAEAHAARLVGVYESMLTQVPARREAGRGALGGERSSVA
jgi:hypothetical protein